MQSTLRLLERRLIRSKQLVDKLPLSDYEVTGISTEIKILPITSKVPDEIIVPIGTSSKPKGLSATKADIVVFFNNKDTRVWYTSTDLLKSHISDNKDKLEFFIDKDTFDTMCVKLNTGDMAHFDQVMTSK